MNKIFEKYKNIFSVQRETKITLFFLLQKDIDTDMVHFMKSHKVSDKVWENNTDNVMDFYNDMIKFENSKKSKLNHLTIFSYSENQLLKYLEGVEKNKLFIKWITTDDTEWLEKIERYFLSEEWFEKSDNA